MIDAHIKTERDKLFQMCCSLFFQVYPETALRMNSVDFMQYCWDIMRLHEKESTQQVLDWLANHDREVRESLRNESSKKEHHKE